MPIYSYKCEHCHYAFDKVAFINNRDDTTCPYCNRKVRKVFGSIPSIFIGSGFYINDYKKEKLTE